MQLFIAEKPSVAKAIAGELGVTNRGDGFIQCGEKFVTWCFGHMLEQAGPDVYLSDDVPVSPSTGKKIWRAQDLPIIPEVWVVEPKDDAKQQLAVIGKLIKKASQIVNAGDPDREGQLLVDAVLEHFGNTSPVKRFWVSAQDSVSVQRGLAALKDNATYKGWAAAALARGRADWLIGMNLSRAYTLRSQRGGGQAVLSIGRVQTPTLGLVVARDREVEAFKPIDFFNITASVQHANGQFKAKWQAKEDQAGLDSEGRLIDKQVATHIAQAINGKSGTIIEHSDTPKKDAHPRAFSLSDITLAASKKFGCSADEVLKACQALYDNKLTSYPRTDCDYLPESQHADAPKVLAALRKVNPSLARIIDAADPGIKSKTWNDDKITAHHGIIPTMHEGDISSFSATEQNIYSLIVRAYLAQFFPVHEYMSTKICIEVESEAFTVSGKTVTRNGWKDVYSIEDEEGDEPTSTDNQVLPSVKQGDSITCVQATLDPASTRPPERFTEGTLGKAMEQIHKYVTGAEHKKILKEGDGIGTSATRASIITELKNKKFLETKGKAIVSTQLGRGLIDALPEVVKSPVLTALYERMLKQIEQNTGSLDAFLAKQEIFIREQVAKANDGSVTIAGASGPVCEKCKIGSLRRFPRKDEAGFFWSCTRFQEGCDATFDDKGGKPVPRVPVTISQIHKCGSCSRGLSRRQGTKRPGKPALPWWSCSGYPACKQSYPDLKGKPDFSKR